MRRTRRLGKRLMKTKEENKGKRKTMTKRYCFHVSFIPASFRKTLLQESDYSLTDYGYDTIVPHYS
jgi:hypothetical protein